MSAQYADRSTAHRPYRDETGGRPRVLAAMSGGVDSSVAAALLVERGFEVIGVTMRLFCYGDRVPDRPCCSLSSINDAANVAQHLGIPHYVLDFQERFDRDVIQNFVAEYAVGRTPIPCVRCNSFTKFGDLLERADALQCDYVATGHYAIAKDGALYRGRDRTKDQTYFLWGIDRPVVRRMLTPVGELTKEQTRDKARELGLATANKQESVEICFVPDDDYVAVLEQHLPENSPALIPGPIVTTDGAVVGEHRGYARYTVGQRRGLPGGFPAPMYVIAIVPESRKVVIGPESGLFGNRLELSAVNWIEPHLDRGAECAVQVRYRSRPVKARVSDSQLEKGTLALDLVEPARAITPGQSGVLYDAGDRLLGGGIIT